MKTIPTIRNWIPATALVVCGLGAVLHAAEPTAFELIKQRSTFWLKMAKW
jgi:hypothetical protein